MSHDIEPCGPELVDILDGPWAYAPIKAYPWNYAGTFNGLLIHSTHPHREPFPVVGMTAHWIEVRVKADPPIRAYTPPLFMEVMN